MDEQEFCLRWSNHEKNMSAVMEAMFRNQILVDVTLTCTDGQPVKAHRTVLSACSPYFETVFKDLSHSHPVIFMKDVKQEDLKALLNFMYKGEVNVKQNRLNSFIKLAEALSVRGLSKTEKNLDTQSQPPPCPPLKEIQTNGKRSPPVFPAHPPVPSMPMYFPAPPMLADKTTHERFVTNSILEESLRKRKRFDNDSVTISSSSTNNNEGSPCSAPEENAPVISMKEKSLSAITAQLHQKKILVGEHVMSHLPPFFFPPKIESTAISINEVKPEVKPEYDDLSHPENSDELSDEESFGAEEFGGEVASQLGPNGFSDGTNAGPSSNAGPGMNGTESPAGDKGRRKRRTSMFNALVISQFEPAENGRWKCRHCQKIVIHRHHHYKVHLGDMYRCLLCKATSNRRDNLVTHIRNMHGPLLNERGIKHDAPFLIEELGATFEPEQLAFQSKLK